MGLTLQDDKMGHIRARFGLDYALLVNWFAVGISVIVFTSFFMDKFELVCLIFFFLLCTIPLCVQIYFNRAGSRLIQCKDSGGMK